MLNWIKNAYNATIGKLDSNVAQWVYSLVNGLWHYLASIFSPVSKEWDSLARTFDRYKTLVTNFGVTIVTRFKDIYDWINKEGYLVYYYISHPDKLATLVVDGVIAQTEADAFAAAEKLGKFFLALIVKHLPALLKMIEDIIDAVF